MPCEDCEEIESENTMLQNQITEFERDQSNLEQEVDELREENEGLKSILRDIAKLADI